MNNPSPLIPQGATPPRAKSSLYFKVLMILTVHVVVIGGMLLQGCKDTAKDQAKTDSTTAATGDTTALVPANPAPVTAPVGAPDVPPTLNPNIQAAYTGSAVTAAPATTPAAGMIPAPKSPDLTSPAAMGETKEYVIAKGDTLGSIARKNGLSLKALMEVNPTVEARKLQIGQKVQIPAASAAVAGTTGTGATPGATADAATGQGAVYVVKSGDMLFRIAKTHGTSVRKIMAMNDLKTTSIRAGQKLKMPAPKVSSSEPAATPAAASVVPPAAASPGRVSAIAPATATSVAAN
jgi:LysM repeat protein